MTKPAFGDIMQTQTEVCLGLRIFELLFKMEMAMKTVLHCDMNNYYASVESVDLPQLRNVPMAVCGDQRLRHGIVLAKNELAKRYGVTTGEPTVSARRKCPGLVIVPPNFRKYQAYTAISREIFARFATKVYPYGMDEAWLVLPEGTTQKGGAFAADELRDTIRRELRITASVGVSFNYVFAKLASDMKKPDATTHLPPERMRDVIWQQPASDLLFVGSSTNRVLSQLGIRTIGDIAEQDPDLLRRVLGKNGETLWRFANGDDSSFDPGIDRGGDAKSVGNSITPPRDITSATDAAAFLYLLSGTVASRLKRHGLKTSCVSINVRREDFVRYTRQCTLPRPTDDQNMIFKYADELLRLNHSWAKGIRSIGVRTDKLTGTHGEQIPLFPDECPVPDIAGRAEEIRRRYGGYVDQNSDDE